MSIICVSIDFVTPTLPAGNCFELLFLITYMMQKLITTSLPFYSLSHTISFFSCFLFVCRATFFAAMDPDGMHLGNPKTAPIFIKNFMTDFKSILGKNHVIQKFDKCDFGPIRRHLEEQKMVKKAITDSERKQNKDVKNTAMFQFGYSLVDGHLEKVGNYNSKCVE